MYSVHVQYTGFQCMLPCVDCDVFLAVTVANSCLVLSLQRRWSTVPFGVRLNTVDRSAQLPPECTSQSPCGHRWACLHVYSWPDVCGGCHNSAEVVAMCEGGCHHSVKVGVIIV